MNASPVESFDGAGVIYTFGNSPEMLKGIFWVMCAVLAIVVVASIIHEIRVGGRHKQR